MTYENEEILKWYLNARGEKVIELCGGFIFRVPRSASQQPTHHIAPTNTFDGRGTQPIPTSNVVVLPSRQPLIAQQGSPASTIALKKTDLSAAITVGLATMPIPSLAPLSAGTEYRMGVTIADALASRHSDQEGL